MNVRITRIVFENTGHKSKFSVAKPVVEIIENADVRIYGNSVLKLTNFSIIADSNGFTFKDNSSNAEGITFSMEDLNKLKQLLENSTIS